jgi:uncharacterized membrane protein
MTDNLAKSLFSIYNQYAVKCICIFSDLFQQQLEAAEAARSSSGGGSGSGSGSGGGGDGNGGR